MRTNIEIDDELMAEAMKLSGKSTKRETVDHALRRLVAYHRRLEILDLPGKVEFAEDPMEIRRRERPPREITGDPEVLRRLRRSRRDRDESD